MTATSFLINTWTAWEEPPRARHQVATELARRYPVSFVTRNRTGRPGIQVEQAGERLSILRPSWPVDYRLRYRLPVVNELYQRWLFASLFDSRRTDAQSVVLNFDHTATQLARFHQRTVYYCNDDHIGNAPLTGFPVSLYHRWAERKVASESRLCVGTSPYLVEKIGAYNPETHLITLGAPELPFKPHPPILRSGDSPRTIGLVGFINSRKVPVSLINRLTEGNSARVVLVGPVTREFRRRLRTPEHVTVRGVLTGEALWREVEKFDVAIAPYDESHSNKGVTPNKMWLYLALGKPVVVTRLPNLAAWAFPPGAVYEARSEDEFIRLVDQAFVEDDASLFQKRIRCADDNTWSRKVDQLLGLLNLTPRTTRTTIG